MYELKQLGDRTYYIESPAKIGVYKVNESDVYIIDSGNDKEAGKKILKILKENDWNLVGIINTHSNADHIGGNNLIQDRTNCKVISTELENAFTKFPILEPSFLYGGYPCKVLRNKFLLAKPTKEVLNIDNNLPDGLECFRLPGHYFDMVGIRTSDDICFIADCLSGSNIIEKYHLVFIYDVKEFLNTLDYIENMEAKLYVPAHAEVTDNIVPVVQANRNKIYEVIDKLLEICIEPLCFEDILKKIFDEYELTMDFNQYVLVGSTVKSYLSYLHDEDKLGIEFNENKLLWKTKI